MDTSNRLQQLAEIFIAAIPEDRRQIWAGKVMLYLAEETRRSASQENEPLRISTKAIYTDLGGNPNQEPSAWLSPIWKEIENRYLDEIKQSLIEMSRKAGLTIYPTVEKENGKPAYYRLAFRPLPEESGRDRVEPMPTHTPQADVIHYKRDLSLKLSTLGRLLFATGLHWTPSKRNGYLTWQLLFMLCAFCFEFLVWAVLWARTQPLSGQDIVLVTIGFVFPWLAYRHFSGVLRLFQDRIVIAPDWALAWMEFGATIEINRAKSPDTPCTIHVSRYSATCPICGWMVKLERSDPTHPRRIIGRCEENPQEHVFSFDRATKQGARLRALSWTSHY